MTEVGHELESCTTKVLPLVIKPSPGASLGSRRLVLIDTPGCNGDSGYSDDQIRNRIKRLYAFRIKRGGKNTHLAAGTKTS